MLTTTITLKNVSKLSLPVKLVSFILLTSFAISSQASVTAVAAGMVAQASERKTVRTPALRSRVYEQLARAQSVADDGDVAGALAILDDVKSKDSSLNSYEKAMMYNFYGFIYYEQEDYDKTIDSFKQAVSQSPIPVSFEQTALFSLAQLSMAQGKYNDVIDYLERWESLNNGVIPPKNYILKAQALYSNKSYAEAAKYIEDAIKNHENEGYLPDENWLILQRAIYYEMKQPEKVKDIIIKLIRLYDQGKYWIQLAGMYGELEQEDKQMATMEIAYQRGFINSASDTYNLAQLYLYHGVPYKSAVIMQQALEGGVLEQNLRNLEFLSVALEQAKEDAQAIGVLEQAAELSDTGKLDARLALLHYNSSAYQKAIDAANEAIKKGELDRPGDTHMVLGLSLFNAGEYVAALDELAKAEEFASSRAAASQWRKYVEKEQVAAQQRAEIAAGS